MYGSDPWELCLVRKNSAHQISATKSSQFLGFISLSESVDHIIVTERNKYTIRVVLLSIRNEMANSMRKLLVGALEFMTLMCQIYLYQSESGGRL